MESIDNTVPPNMSHFWMLVPKTTRKRWNVNARYSWGKSRGTIPVKEESFLVAEMSAVRDNMDQQSRVTSDTHACLLKQTQKNTWNANARYSRGNAPVAELQFGHFVPTSARQ
jgi:hypothetical protein